MAGAEEHAKHVKVYLTVFATLLILTIATVAASRLDFSHGMHVFVALLIAVGKASLVALFFMHLKSERSALYSILALCVVLFVVLLALPVLTQAESERYRIQPTAAVPETAHPGDH